MALVGDGAEPSPTGRVVFEPYTRRCTLQDWCALLLHSGHNSCAQLAPKHEAPNTIGRAQDFQALKASWVHNVSNGTSYGNGSWWAPADSYFREDQWQRRLAWDGMPTRGVDLPVT
jgi:hypothetical protein